MPQTPHDPTFFDPHVVKTTAIGGFVGMIGVIAAFAIGVALTGGDRTTIGAAALVAPFGGAGFGAMIGAVLGAIKIHEAEEAERRSTRAGATDNVYDAAT